jgi:hypothetical protein
MNDFNMHITPNIFSLAPGFSPVRNCDRVVPAVSTASCGKPLKGLKIPPIGYTGLKPGANEIGPQNLTLDRKENAL